MLGLGGKPAIGRSKAQTKPRKHRCWPLLL